MKKWIIFLLAMLLLLSCWGCTSNYKDSKTIYFYYTVDTFTDSVFQAEGREDWQTPVDLEQVLRLYLQGPISDDLHSPFSSEHKLIRATVSEGTVYVTLNQSFGQMSGLDLILACGCLSKTCLELTGAEKVVISAENSLLDGTKSITMDYENLLLIDQTKPE